MFWSKVECDGCDAKLAKSKAMLHRGSYFCSTTCRDAWTVKNPPRIAQGDPEAMKRDLIETIGTALDEHRLSAGDFIGDMAIGMIPIVGKANVAMDVQVRSEHNARFLQYAHECLPLLHGLGYAEEAAVLGTLGFGGRVADVITALQRARDRALYVAPSARQ